MARPPTGELGRLADGAYQARITIEGRRREWFTLPTCATEPEARARMTALAEIATRLRRAGQTEDAPKLLAMAARARLGRPWDNVIAAVDAILSGSTEEARASVIPTFQAFADEWTSGKLHKRFPDHVRVKDGADDASRLKLYVYPHIGDRRLDELSLLDFDNVMANLPDELESGTRRHVAQVVGRVMKLAVYPGRHVAASPIPRGWLPNVGKARARSYVYPDEDQALMACTASVPLWRRLLWGFIAREGTRGPSEALAFRWRHVDLVRGAVRLDKNKTDDPRVWPLSPGVFRALLAWKKLTRHDSGPNDLIFLDEDGRQPHETQLAEQLRVDLKAAGVTRPELFEHNEHRVKLRAHDLRASFITVALANGRSETWITDRTGHTTSGQLMNYRRAARTVAELALGDFKPLDEAIPELRPLPRDCPEPGREGSNSPDLGSPIEPVFPIDADSGLSGPAFGSAYRGSNPCAGTESRGNGGEMEPRGGPASPRATAIAALYASAATLAAAGDIAAARALHETISKLLDADIGSPGARVIDLAERRGR